MAKKSKDGVRLRGLGLDVDGEFRLTTGDGYTLHGGSEETHEHMQEVTARLEEGLQRSGKDIREVGHEELSKRLRDAIDKTRGK